MSNKRRHAQAFPLTATLVGVAIAVCLAVFGIKALAVKYQVIQGGEKLKRLERELREFTNQNEALIAQKEKLIAVPELMKAIQSGFVKMVQIDDDEKLVHVGRPLPAHNPALAKVAPPEVQR